MENLGDILRRVTLRRISEGGAASPALEEAPNAEPACEVCKGRGWVTLEVPLGHPQFGKAQPCRCQADASQEERLQRLQRYSNLGMLLRCTFDNLEPPDATPELRQHFQETLAAARAYAQGPQGWFVLTGPSASGKTHLAAAIANACLERGHPAFFMTVPDLLDHLRATYGPTSEVPYDTLFDQVRNAPLLVLDDLGTHSATPWAQEKLYQLLNHRFLAPLPTVVALACPLETLDERLRTRLVNDRVSQVHHLPSSAEAPTLQPVGALEEEMLARMTFDRFDVRGGPGTSAEGRQTLEAAYAFARNFARDPDGWLVLSGVPGCGKTHLAVAIAGERVRQGQPVTFVMVPDLLDYLRYTFSPQSQVTYDQVFEQVKKSPLLVLDDLGAEMSTPWAQEKLHQIVAHRHNARLPTVITTSVPKLDNLPPAIASRLSDASLVELSPIAAHDYRPKETGRYRAPRSAPSPGRGRPGRR